MLTPGAFNRRAFNNTAFNVGTGTIEMTFADVIDRVQAVLEAAPLSLTQTADPFSHDRQPTRMVSQTYYVEDAGNVNSRPVGNYLAVRIDRFRVFVALKIDGAPHTAKQSLQSTLLTIERYVKADGPAYGYHVDLGGARQVTHKKGSEFLVGSVTLSADYDVDEATE